jgi:hypothetical protein
LIPHPYISQCLDRLQHVHGHVYTDHDLHYRVFPDCVFHEHVLDCLTVGLLVCRHQNYCYTALLLMVMPLLVDWNCDHHWIHPPYLSRQVAGHEV